VPQSALGGRAAASAQGAAWFTPEAELVHRRATNPPRTRRHRAPPSSCVQVHTFSPHALTHRRIGANAPTRTASCAAPRRRTMNPLLHRYVRDNFFGLDPHKLTFWFGSTQNKYFALDPRKRVLDPHKLLSHVCVPVHVPPRRARPLLDAMMHLTLCAAAPAPARRRPPPRHAAHRCAKRAGLRG